MFIGTHSRKIEGDLIEFCNQQGWTLLRERPCQFYSQAKAPTLAGSTHHDGGQFWINDNVGGTRRKFTAIRSTISTIKNQLRLWYKANIRRHKH